MVYNHAIMLDPGWNEPMFAHALTSVSCTRSSAREVRPHNDIANARRLGSAARRSSFTPAVTPAAPLFEGLSLDDPPVALMIVLPAFVPVPQAASGIDPAPPRPRPPRTPRVTGARCGPANP